MGPKWLRWTAMILFMVVAIGPQMAESLFGPGGTADRILKGALDAGWPWTW